MSCSTLFPVSFSLLAQDAWTLGEAWEDVEIGAPFGKLYDSLLLKPWPLSSLIFPFKIVIFKPVILVYQRGISS